MLFKGVSGCRSIFFVAKRKPDEISFHRGLFRDVLLMVRMARPERLERSAFRTGI